MPAEWQHEQHFELSGPGLVKISLPAETLDAARPALEDLRIYDDAGNEQPFWIDRPTPGVRVVQAAKSFQAALGSNSTLITIETGLTQSLDGITLETPAGSFIKAVRVEGSNDGTTWRVVEQGLPIFRQPYGAEQLRLKVSPGVRRWLRLTVDDQRSQPIPFTGAMVQGAVAASAPGEIQTVPIKERDEGPGETRLTLNLGAANLDVTAVTLETGEPLFTRQVTLAMPQVAEDGIREQTIGQGLIYRIALEGRDPSMNLALSVNRLVPARELVLLIHNLDSPPLAISGARVERRPVYLVFMARHGGRHHLLTGNRLCAVPRYDIAALGSSLKNVAGASVLVSGVSPNPDYRAPEALPGLELTGAAMTVTDWKYRKAVQLKAGSAWQVELDPDVLAHCAPGFADVRLVRGSNQVPYLIERTSITRLLAVTVTEAGEAKNPRLSRWLIHLPRAGVPVARLTCFAKSALFERKLVLSEEVTDERGEKHRRALGEASWVLTPDHKARDFALVLSAMPQTDTLILETENGDNAPLELENFAAFYSATRAVFKARPEDQLHLYHGNPRGAAPNYDLGLVAAELLAAGRANATLGSEEQLKKDAWVASTTGGAGGVVFWAMLAVVVAVLLAIIARLLPKPAH